MSHLIECEASTEQNISPIYMRFLDVLLKSFDCSA